ncbi:MAG: aldo/keto reductase [Bacteroides sp.]|nr:aldo/keto reductase [Bacteroides sp.]
MKSKSNKVSRRSFLKIGAAMGAAMCVPSVVTNAMGANSSAVINNSTTADNDLPFIKESRTLGNGKHALRVSALGLGMMGMNYHRGPHPDKQAMIKLTRQAVERGVTFIDTAIGYGPYTNEELTGEALEPFKNKMVYGTKFYDGTDRGAALERYIQECLESSLKRLRIDTIDLYYLHRYSGNVPIEEIVVILQKFIKEGKIKHYGLSEVNAETIRKAHAVEPVTALQSEYHLMWREPEKNVLPVCKELGIGFVPYSPVNRGFLTGAINEYTRFDMGNDNRNILPRFTPEAIRSNTRIVEVLNAFGRTRGMTAAQVAQAWLLTKEQWIVPITGTTKLAHLEENLRTLDFTLSPEEMAELENGVSQITIVGDRYPASEQQRVGH